jgi:hypothetical protein
MAADRPLHLITFPAVAIDVLSSLTPSSNQRTARSITPRRRERNPFLSTASSHTFSHLAAADVLVRKKAGDEGSLYSGDRLTRLRGRLRPAETAPEQVGGGRKARIFLVVGKARDRRAPRRFSVLRRLRDRGRGQVPRRARRFRPQAVSWLPVSIFQRSRQMMVTCWVITGVDGQWHFVRFFTLLFDEV